MPADVPACRAVRIAQAGEMVFKPGASPRRFRAVEDLDVARVAFTWRAKFPILGALALHVTDRYEGGDGELDVRLLGLPLQRRRGPELAQGEAYRYLAEIAWAPPAILANPELEWREVDERTAEVSTRVADARVAVRLIFNAVGELTRTEAERPRAEAGNEITRWVGVFDDYADVMPGLRIPRRGEVSWDLPGGPFTYWRGTVTSLELR